MPFLPILNNMLLFLPVAFISGILTVFTPCALPVLPIVLASGIGQKIARVRGIILGIVISFTIISLSLATIVRLLNIPADTIRSIAVFLLLFFGFSLLFPKIWERFQIFIERYWWIRPFKNEKGDFPGGVLTGVSLGVVWTPCVGPIVATVATLASINSLSFMSILLVFTYALGAGSALYFVAKGGGKLTQKLGFLKENNQRIRKVFGLIVLLTAFFILAGLDRKLQAWTLAVLPNYWTQLPTNFENKFNVFNELQNLKKDDQSLKKAVPGSTVVRDVRLASDFTGAKIDSSDLIQGCFGGKDCIPSIDKPKFEDAKTASSWLSDNDLVFALSYKGVNRVYPQRILNWHEIVNDTIAGDPIAITFCPLCGSSVAFERKVDRVTTELGVSGKLHNSDLVMYDRYEGNLWQQITGEGIVGPAARRNEKLRPIVMATTTWGEWKKEHPESEVLSRDTGQARDYDQYPYGTYEQDDEIYFGVKDLNRQLQIKTVVYGIELDGKSKAYPESAFEKNKVIEDKIGSIPIKLEKKQSGEIDILNLQTNEKIVPIRLFWFAWAAFHPETELYINK